MASLYGNNQSGMGILGSQQIQPWQNTLGILASALKDATNSFSGNGGDTDNLSKWNATQGQNQQRQQLIAGLTSEDPAIRQQAYGIAPLFGVDPSAFQKQRAAQAFPQLLTAMQPQQVTAPAAQADAGEFGKINVPAANLGTAPGMGVSDALSSVNSPELNALYLPKLLDQAMAGPVKIGKDERLFSPTDYSRPLVDVAPEKVDYNKAFLPDGTPNTAYQDYAMRERSAGRPQMSVNVSADRSFGTQLGENAGKILDSTHSAAVGGVQTIQTAAQIKNAIATGNVSAGPGASIKQTFGQLFGGDQQKLNATRATIQGLAKLTLAGRKQLSGQGAVSDNEGRLLAQAESGNIDGMSTGEIAQIADVAERVARQNIRINKQTVGKALKAAPGNRDLVDFYNVDEPPPYAQSKPGAGSDIDALVNQYKTKPGSR